VIARRIGPVNERRLAKLDEIERAFAPEPPPLEALFDALLVPVIELRKTAPNFFPIMGRLYVEPGDIMASVIHDHMAPVAARFIPVLQRTLPHVPLRVLLWRIHFTIGALGHIMAGSALIRAISAGQTDIGDIETIRRQVIPFLVAGFKAPAPKEDT